MADMSARLGALYLKNPVIPASGCFGYGHEFAQLYDINELGAIAVKGTTPLPRSGNPLPRIAEAPGGMLNSVGLQNPGVDAVISDELPRLRAVYYGPVIVNISGFCVEDYVLCAERLRGRDGVAALEVNISCPNVHGGGMAFGSDPASAARVTQAVKLAADAPVFVKLSPNVTDIAEIARACEGAGADGLTLINTLLSMRIDLSTRRPVLANTTGGLSGAAVLPVALRMVWQVWEAVKIPIIGCGGVCRARDVIEMMLAGASAVEVGAANLKNPFACRDIVSELPEEAARLGITNLRDITGGAHG